MVVLLTLQKPDGTCLLTFLADYFLGLSLHPSAFYQRFKICINNVVSSDFWY